MSFVMCYRMITFSVVIAAFFILNTEAFGHCYAPGPAFPKFNFTATEFESSGLSSKLNSLINAALSDGYKRERWDPKTTSFGVQITSGNETTWQSYHTAAALGNYTDGEPSPFSGDTAFRIASITKSFVVYAVLLENGIGLDDPITKYIPALLEKNAWDPRPFYWDRITVRSLASQLSGLGRVVDFDLAVKNDDIPDPVAAGFPPITSDDPFIMPCLKNSTDRPCTVDELIDTVRNRSSIFAPNDRSTYSNIGYVLLGLALENATGKAFPDILQSSVLQPLGMSDTTLTRPKDSEGIIPVGRNSWTLEFGPASPAGGLYSTSNDLSRYLRSILYPTLLPRSVVNEWMKPHSWTASGSSSAYGMPWEILRSTKLTSDGRPIDVITKGGGLEGYFSMVVMIPEFNVGYSILVAGDYAALDNLNEKIIALLVPAVEDIVRAKIKKSYEGVYAAPGKNFYGPLDENFLVRLAVDDIGPGLRIANWTSNGTDFLSFYGKMKGMPNDTSQWTARLLPTGADWAPTVEIWRATAVPLKKAEDEKKIFDDYCFTDVDSLIYGGFSVEEFVFQSGPMGSMQQDGFKPALLTIEGLRQGMFKGEEYDDARESTTADQSDESQRLKVQRRQEANQWHQGNWVFK